MKKYSLVFLFVSVSLLFLFSCKKINEPTTLGGDIIPAVDNVNTFETALSSVTKNALMNDSTRFVYSDFFALGDINDNPEFGTSHANVAFTIVPSTIGIYPFGNFNQRDSTYIDSVVLSLSYQGSYGDTIGNGIQTLHVYEISPTSTFSGDSAYRYNDASTDYAETVPGGTIGSELGSKTFTIKRLGDSIPLPRRIPADSALKTANEVRIRLDTNLGRRFVRYDTSASLATGGYYLDSTEGGPFRKLFRGLAIKADHSGNAFSYYSLTDFTKTKLTVYFRTTNNGVRDTSSYDFVHANVSGQANYINHDKTGSAWASALSGNSDKLYIQGSPSGAYGSIIIPDLNAFSNKVIHRAEIIAYKLPTTNSNKFPPPSMLFLDRLDTGQAAIFQNDFSVGIDGSIDFANFGGVLHGDSTYIFNVTRYVQGIVTRHERNDTLRIFSPLRINEFAANLGIVISIPVQPQIGDGRVLLAGGNYIDPRQRLRLRIIYSNL